MNLKEIRKKVGLSPTEVAHMLEINLNEYRAIENGNANPTIDQLVKLSDIFNVTIDNLLGHNSPTPLSRGEAIWLNIRASLPKDKLQTIAQMLNGVNDLQLSEDDIERICNIADDQITSYNENSQIAQLFQDTLDSDELTFEDYLILRKIESGEEIVIDNANGNTVISSYSFTYDGKFYNKSNVSYILSRLYFKFDLLSLYFYFDEKKKKCSETYAGLNKRGRKLLEDKRTELKENKV